MHQKKSGNILSIKTMIKPIIFEDIGVFII